MYSYDRRVAFKADDDLRQEAYGIAKDLANRPIDDSPLTKKLAREYFELMHKHGTEGERAAAAGKLWDQCEASRDAAQSLARVMDKWATLFKQVRADHIYAARAGF